MRAYPSAARAKPHRLDGRSAPIAFGRKVVVAWQFARDGQGRRPSEIDVPIEPEERGSVEHRMAHVRALGRRRGLCALGVTKIERALSCKKWTDQPGDAVVESESVRSQRRREKPLIVLDAARG